jgi:spermidine synthase
MMPVLAAHVMGFGLLSRMGLDRFIRHPKTDSGLWYWSVDTVGGTSILAVAAQLAAFYGFFLAIFITSILIFIPIGQLTGRMMKQLPPIRAYTINIVGSLGGVVLFSVASYLWLPPVFWFGLAAGMAWYLTRTHRASLALSAPFAAVLLMWLGANWSSIVSLDVHPMQHIYSPYQHLEIQPDVLIDENGRRLHRGVDAFANRSYHLRAVDLSDAWVAAHGAEFPQIAKAAAGYNLPYVFSPEPRRVLIIGAGAGNDVAAALRRGGAEMHVDAVEIDPAIHQIGLLHHPERPYKDSRVAVHIDDARHFMKRSRERYDLIVFGLLDSHTLLSGMSDIRLDNFVYTRQSFEEARRILAPGGTLVLSFCTGPTDPISMRIYNMLRALFPEAPPRAFHIGADGGTYFVTGLRRGPAPPLGDALAEAEVTDIYRAASPDAFPPDTTDDWPFLYMTHREIPSSHLWLVTILALISILWIRRTAGRRPTLSGHFFFLGGAFLLIEVKGITELALVWGTTWMVNCAVIVGVLVFVLLANLYVTRIRPVRLTPYYAALVVTLILGYALHIDKLLAHNWHVAAVVSAATLLAPLFFAGVIFATSLKACASVSAAFASNLLGAIVGGFCEYSAMATGFRVMYLLAIGLYVASYICLRRPRWAAVRG